MKNYIYALKNPTTNEVVYIGKTKDFKKVYFIILYDTQENCHII